MTTQVEQTEFFPKTTMEVLESLRAFHVADVEKAATALESLDDDEKVARRYEKAEERLAAARDLVHDIDRAIHELGKMDRGKTKTPEAHDIFDSDAIDTDGVGVDPTVPPAVDPLPGAEGSTLADPGPETPAPDFTSPLSVVDSITGEVEEEDENGREEQSGTVTAFYPGDDEPHETQVGDRTRYGELVADWFTAVGDHTRAVDADEWTVIARRELTQGGAGRRNLHDIISPEDYGQELLVVALEQGSVTGTPAEKVAT